MVNEYNCCTYVQHIINMHITNTCNLKVHIGCCSTTTTKIDKFRASHNQHQLTAQQSNLVSKKIAWTEITCWSAIGNLGLWEFLCRTDLYLSFQRCIHCGEFFEFWWLNSDRLVNGNIAQPDIFRIWQMDETWKVCWGIKDCGEKWRGLYLGCQVGANTTSLGRLDEHDEFELHRLYELCSNSHVFCCGYICAGVCLFFGSVCFR